MKRLAASWFWISFFFILLSLLIAIIFSAQFPHFLQTAGTPTIITGESNPGRIAIYQKDTTSLYTKKTIDTGFRFVWTVRLGKINSTYNKIYAGVSDSYYGDRIHCQILEFDPKADFKKTVIDDIDDVRCKDVAVGDLDNDGSNELVVATHGRGIIKYYKWQHNNWIGKIIDENFIHTYDETHGGNHKYPEDKLPFSPTVETAAHTVRIGDADNDGKNELIATISDPIENQEQNHIAFVRMYKLEKNGWQKSTIVNFPGPIPFKILADIVDLKDNEKHAVLVGAAPHTLSLYTFKNNKWEKKIIDNSTPSDEHILKATAIGSIANETRSIFAGAGDPAARLYRYTIYNNSVTKKKLVDISALLKPYRIFEGLGENVFDIKLFDTDGDGKKELISVGAQDTSFEKEITGIPKFGFEATTLGYTAVSKQKENGDFQTEFLDFHSVTALDTGNL